MADISKMKVLDGTTYDLKDATSRTYVNNAKNNYGYQYKTDVVVFGESNKYYPVYLNGGNQDIPREVMIVRSYGERAPSDWNTSTHKGGLTVKIKLNYGGWGGAEYKSVILDFAQSYSTTFAKVQAGVNSGMNAAFWLRGGGETGAIFHFYSDQELVNTRYHGTFPFVGTTQGDYIMYTGDTPESSQYKWTVPAPLTAQDINDINSRYTDKLSQDALAKANGVTNVAWDSTNKKFTKTINGTTSDVATAATLRTGLNVADGAEVNQNAFSNVKVGSTTVAADSKTDTLELVAGSNVTLTPDATNDKVTIAATDTTYESKSAASGGTAVSLVTTGEKYTWNNKSTVPTNHASTATTYGAGSSSNYGHVKLSASTSSTSAENGGIAATPSAVKTAYDLAGTANTTANTALSGVNGNLIYDHTFTISNGIATFTPHVYQKGQEVTTNYAKSCFTWKYRLINGSEVTLTTKNDRGCDVTITNLGYGGHIIGIFTPA